MGKLHSAFKQGRNVAKINTQQDFHIDVDKPFSDVCKYALSTSGPLKASDRTKKLVSSVYT